MKCWTLFRKDRSEISGQWQTHTHIERTQTKAKWIENQPNIQITNAICTANNEQFGSNLKTQNEECVLKIKNLRRDLEFGIGEIRLHCFHPSDATRNILPHSFPKNSHFTGPTKPCPAIHSFQSEPCIHPHFVFHSALIFSNRIFSLQSRLMACNVNVGGVSQCVPENGAPLVI